MHGRKVQELAKRLEAAERQGSGLRKRLLSGQGDEDALLITVADMMTILLIFFVMLYHLKAVPQAPVPGQRPVSQVVFPIPSVSPSSDRTAAEPLPQRVLETEAGGDGIDAGFSMGSDEANRLEREAYQVMGPDQSGDFFMRMEDRRLLIVLGERITFDLGKAEVRDPFNPVMRRMARFLTSKPEYRVVISGHTDDLPIQSDRFPSNWELSAARAVSVGRFLIREGVNPARITVEGSAEHRPLVVNDSEMHRQMNRRVEVRLVPE